MIITFLYIDDDKLNESKEKVQGFENPSLKIITNQHETTWESQIRFIKENEPILDGLLLDLRLDDFPNAEGGRADFRGTSLAQEIRTRQKEGAFKSFPIILFSGNDKLEQSLEQSGKDLFDICIDKGKITTKSYDVFSPQLVSVATGYKFLIEETNNLTKILNVDIEKIDERFIAQLNEIGTNPIHVIARFLIDELIEKRGLLIDEVTLAARLGIEVEQSPDWNKVLSSLTNAEYRGVFSLGWKRWWMPLVEEWWKMEIEADTYLRSTSASKRVERIKEKLKIENIKPSERIPKAESEEYWTVCKGYNKPLDPVDGLMIEGQENLYPWQDAEYVSIDAALMRKNNSIWKKVAKLEEDRLSELEQQFKRNR